MRRVAQVILTALLIGSLALTGWQVWLFAQSGPGSALVERTGVGLAAAMDRALSRRATPEVLAQLLEERLAEDPRNWLAIDALSAMAAERDISLPPDLIARRDTLLSQDSGFFASAGACIACAWDPRACGLSAELLCQAPMVLTPVGDLTGLARGAGDYVLGRDVATLEVGLSAIGLGATALALATGGSAYALGIGSRSARMARRMGLLSPRLADMTTDTIRRGFDWPALASARSAGDIRAAARMDVLRPAVATLGDLGRTREALGTPAMLHMLRHVETPADARRIANAAEAMGPRSIGAIEVLGRSRFLRITLRAADTVWALAASVIAAAGAAAGILAQRSATGFVRVLSRLARPR